MITSSFTGNFINLNELYRNFYDSESLSSNFVNSTLSSSLESSPRINYFNFKEHVFFDRAVNKLDSTMQRIINEYPIGISGSSVNNLTGYDIANTNIFLNKSTDFEKFVVNYLGGLTSEVDLNNPTITASASSNESITPLVIIYRNADNSLSGTQRSLCSDLYNIATNFDKKYNQITQRSGTSDHDVLFSSSGFDLYSRIIPQVIVEIVNRDSDLNELIPDAYFYSDNEKILERYLAVIGRVFDDIKLYIDEFSNLNRISYDKYHRTPEGLFQILLAKQYGIELVENSLNEQISRYLRSVNNKLPTNIVTKIILYRILNNLIPLLKYKGTKESIESIIRIFGLPTNYLSINDYRLYPEEKIQRRIDYPNVRVLNNTSASGKINFSPSYSGFFGFNDNFTIESRIATTADYSQPNSGIILWFGSSNSGYHLSYKDGIASFRINDKIVSTNASSSSILKNAITSGFINIFGIRNSNSGTIKTTWIDENSGSATLSSLETTSIVTSAYFGYAVDLNLTTESTLKSSPNNLTMNDAEKLSNTGFENGSSAGWLLFGSPTQSITSSITAKSGSVSYVIYNTGATFTGISTTSTVTANKIFTIQAYVESVSGASTGDVALIINGVGISSITANPSSTGIAFNKIVRNLSSSADGTITATLACKNGASAYFDDISFSEAYDFTFGCWFKSYGYVSHGSTINSLMGYKESGDILGGYGFYYASNNFLSVYSNGANLTNTEGDRLILDSSTNYNDGNWHFAVASISRTGIKRLIVDNIVKASLTSNSILGNMSSTSVDILGIGRDGFAVRSISGQIGRAFILKGYAYTEQDAQQAFLNEIHFTSGTAVAYYKWEGEDDVTFLQDESTSNNDLTGTEVTQADDQVRINYPITGITGNLSAFIGNANSGISGFVGYIHEVKGFSNNLSEIDINEHTKNFESISTTNSEGDPLTSLRFHYKLKENKTLNSSNYIIDSSGNSSTGLATLSLSGINPYKIIELMRKETEITTFGNFIEDNTDFTINDNSATGRDKAVNKGLLSISFKPINAINDDIENVLGNYNNSNLISNPSNFFFSSTGFKTYPAMEATANTVFSRYDGQKLNINPYIKAIGNFSPIMDGITNLIEQFIPARTKLLSKGIFIEPHILNRSKSKQTIVRSSYEDNSVTSSALILEQNYEDLVNETEIESPLSSYQNISNAQNVDQDSIIEDTTEYTNLTGDKELIILKNDIGHTENIRTQLSEDTVVTPYIQDISNKNDVSLLFTTNKNIIETADSLSSNFVRNSITGNIKLIRTSTGKAIKSSVRNLRLELPIDQNGSDLLVSTANDSGLTSSIQNFVISSKNGINFKFSSISSNMNFGIQNIRVVNLLNGQAQEFPILLLPTSSDVSTIVGGQVMLRIGKIIV